MKSSRTKKKLFSLEARLSRNQRKYCSCLIDVRNSFSNRKNQTNLGAEYPICYSSIRKSSGYDSKKKRPIFNKMMFNYYPKVNKYQLNTKTKKLIK